MVTKLWLQTNKNSVYTVIFYLSHEQLVLNKWTNSDKTIRKWSPLVLKYEYNLTRDYSDVTLDVHSVELALLS